MLQGIFRALYNAPETLLEFLRSISGYLVSWPMQETTGTTAIADNVAVALGRDVASRVYADYVPGPGWSDGGGGVADCDGTQAASSALAETVGTNWAAGLIWKSTLTITNYVAGSVKAQLGSAGNGTNRSADGVYVENILGSTGNKYSVVADVDFVGSIDLTLSLVQQTDIADSSAGLGLLDGTYSNVTLAQQGAGNMPYFVAFNGTDSVLDTKNTEHNSMFNPLSFEIVLFGNDFTWDATVRTLLNYYVDASNYIRIDKTAVAGQLAVYYQEQGQALVPQLIATGSPTGLFSVGLGVESNVYQATYNGVQSGANQATTSALVGNFTVMNIGARDGSNFALGSLAYPTEFDGLLSATVRLQINAAFGV